MYITYAVRSIFEETRDQHAEYTDGHMCGQSIKWHMGLCPVARLRALRSACLHARLAPLRSGKQLPQRELAALALACRRAPASATISAASSTATTAAA